MLDQDMANLRGIERTTVATVIGNGERQSQRDFLISLSVLPIVRVFKRHLTESLIPERDSISSRQWDAQG